ncbi:MAG: exodeoxyribonuclease-1 [Pseudohongiellaceae bacterium]|jgi:exodeoxyribonuclease-1
MQTIFWHDYETFGIDTKKDKPSQFAGVRTDLDLNIVGSPLTIYCKPSEDSLPSPDACLVTGITPQVALQEGMIEAEFAKAIHNIFSAAGTCVAGYNSIRFDDEVSRNLFYRNFYDPYEREWKNGNSRWDIIDVVRLTYALRPEGINWPVGDDEQPTFRLEKLSAANGITHESAHDAMSDVYATIGIAKLIKTKQPQLFDYIFSLRYKQAVSKLFDVETHKPIFHVSSKFPVSLGCCALVAPLFQHPKNKNGFVVFDLRQDPKHLLGLSVDEIRQRLYTATKDLNEGEVRPALKTIHINKCPMVVPASMLKTIPVERQRAWQLNIDIMQQHLQWLRDNPEIIRKLISVFDLAYEKQPTVDPDLMIYSGGFFSQNDKASMNKIRESNEQTLAEGEFIFQDSRLTEMLFRYKARNYPATLTEEEHSTWEQHCAGRILNADSQYMNVQQFSNRLVELSQNTALTAKDQAVLQDLQYYAESIIPYS